MTATDGFSRGALLQRLYDAFEDAGLYSPDRDMVEGVYEDAVEPLRKQLAATTEALHLNALEAATAQREGKA
jgi:hypothetical protein